MHAYMISRFSHDLTLCDPMDSSPPGSSVLGIFQARILEWVVVPFSRDLPNLGIEPMSLLSPALQMGSLPLAPPGKFPSVIYGHFTHDKYGIPVQWGEDYLLNKWRVNQISVMKNSYL